MRRYREWLQLSIDNFQKDNNSEKVLPYAICLAAYLTPDSDPKTDLTEAECEEYDTLLDALVDFEYETIDDVREELIKPKFSHLTLEELREQI